MSNSSGIGGAASFNLGGSATSYSLSSGNGIKSADQIARDIAAADEHMFGLLACDPGYEFFGTRALRNQLFAITEQLVNAVREEGAEALVLTDRSARLAHVAFKALWDLQHGDELAPEIFFVNPRGFRPNDTDTLDEHMRVTGTGRHGDHIDSPKNRRTANQIQQDFATTHAALIEYRNDPVLVFDTCVHTGDQAFHVLDTFRTAGFKDVTFAVASATPIIPGAPLAETSKVIPDVIFMDSDPAGYCWPFGKDRTTQKTYASVLASPHSDLAENFDQNNRLRLEIRKIIKEEANQQ